LETAAATDAIITRNNIAIARVQPTPAALTKSPRQPGSAKHLLVYMADDFDRPPPTSRTADDDAHVVRVA
ncbi:MAG: hypothetical protein H7Z41_07140, partial [Cytophagales bacterium]|nr:hypothetical protein [Armatimonadota bacterium]